MMKRCGFFIKGLIILLLVISDQVWVNCVRKRIDDWPKIKNTFLQMQLQKSKNYLFDWPKINNTFSELKQEIEEQKKINEIQLSSFLQLKSQLQLQISGKSQLSVSDKMFLQGLKKRTTQDGRKCASKFQQEGKVYYDCITLKAPDGKNTRKEWCYVDPSEGGAPNWGYCAPQLDFDTVREKANQLALMFTPQLRKAIDLVNAQLDPTAKCSIEYKHIQDQHLVLDSETTLLEKQIKEIIGIRGQLSKMKKQWENHEKEVVDVLADIQVLLNQQEGENDKECEGMLGYEKDQPGDGLKGEYYNNEDFLGNPLIKEDMGVDFDWNGQAPMPDIFPDNFSIRWTTFLKVPVSGKYSFKTASDDGCAVYINDQLIVSHFMGVTDGPKDSSQEESGEENGGAVKSHLDASINNYEEGQMVTPPRKSSSWSKEVAMTSDSMYKMQILYYHSIHSKFAEDARNYFKLYWQSDKFTEVEIHPDYVYQSNKAPTLKVLGYNSSFMIMFTLENNQKAFLDTPTMILQDIPSQFLGLVQLRLPQFLRMSSIHLQATGPLILYIATHMMQASPLPADFKPVGEVMSILKISKFAENKQGKIRASGSIPMKIYKKHFVNGEILVEFPVEEEEDEEGKEEGEDKGNDNKGGLSLVMWYQLDSSASGKLSCGGLESDISKNDQPSYKGCTASSQLNEQYKCEYAFTGGLMDNPFKTWASDGEGTGAWIQVEFKKEYKLTHIIYKNRENMGERSRKLQLLFSNGMAKVIEVKNTDTPQTLTFPPTICRSVKITFLSVYTANNNGGSFQVYGMPCVDNSPKKKGKKPAESEQEEAPPKQEEEEEEEEEELQVVPLDCKDTMTSNDYLVKKNFKPGDSFQALCQEQCADKGEFKVFGSRTYSEDSSLCRAGEHMGVNQKGKKFKVLIERFRNMYEGAAQNGIQSENKMTNEGSKSVSFTGVKDEAVAALDAVKVGMKVDLFDPKKKIWQPAVVKTLDRRKINLLFVVVGIDGYAAEFDESLTYPDPARIDLCGARIASRKDCPQDEQPDKKKKKAKVIKICFSNGDTCSPDYPDMTVDNGFTKKVQKNGYSFGWDTDASGNLRKRGKQQDPLTDNLMLFPPDAKSQWCTGAMAGKISCVPLKWTIDLPNGPYSVKITVGDPLFSSAVSINVNNLPFINAQLLKRNQFFTKEQVVLVGTDQLVIDGICKAKDCKNVWSRINYIEISKTTMPKPVAQDAAKKLGCGNAYVGGECAAGLLVENCLFASLEDQGVKNCGQLFKLVKIPKLYECKDQREKFKCIKVNFKDNGECKKSCPGKCVGKDCKVLPY